MSRIKSLLLPAGLLFLLLSVSGIRMDSTKQVYHYFVVFDITQSMNVQDIILSGARTSRLEYGKHLLQESLSALPCDSTVALGVFTGHRSFVLFKPVEICEHYSEILHAIAAIDWRMAWEARSEVSKGLYSALEVSQQMDEALNLIFLTDGHEAPPLHSEYRPRYQGDRTKLPEGIIFGIGGEKPVAIPKYDYNGKFMGFWRASEVLQIDVYTQGRTTTAEENLVGVDKTNLQQRIEQGREHLSSLKQKHLIDLSNELKLGYQKMESLQGLRDQLLNEAMSDTIDSRIDPSKSLASLALICIVLYYLIDLIRYFFILR